LPEKAIYWESKKILLIADLHLGKARHFRANGLAVPTEVEQTNWGNLGVLINDLNPIKVLILGDLFHSSYNQEVANFKAFITDFPNISFELVIGNHDVLGLGTYVDINLAVHVEELIIPPFIFTHEPIQRELNELYNLAGHIHPSVILKGKGRSRQKLPCFYFSKKVGLFPAFGAFTGTAEIKPSKKDCVYIIADEQVIAV
tara:strand:- start:4328 stop:4930 length:603 start_codon:yes stop_codon:yes gene_type:complete